MGLEKCHSDGGHISNWSILQTMRLHTSSGLNWVYNDEEKWEKKKGKGKKESCLREVTLMKNLDEQ
jgi:hypothetical protein